MINLFATFQIFESDEFTKFSARREIRVHKGRAGLGIMIIEGSHKATGNGIFVSDIQEKSAAFHVRKYICQKRCAAITVLLFAVWAESW